ncbi:MAG: maleylpyruvate isomerase N-terminal domain-containing protein, partial [Nocardioidaceae bacterium]
MSEPVEALAGIYGAVDDLTWTLQPAHYEAATGCAQFSVRRLLFHLLLDARRALVALADPVGVPPDTDSVSYWRKYVAGIADGDDVAHAGYVQRSALAYGTPSSPGATPQRYMPPRPGSSPWPGCMPCICWAASGGIIPGGSARRICSSWARA